MFTGIVIGCGTVVERRDTEGNLRLRIALPQTVARSLRKGDSIALDGICLTVTQRRGRMITVDVVPETQRRTTVGTWYPGRRVNIELPLRASQPLGGHWVQGHVDGTTVLLEKYTGPANVDHVYRLPAEWRPLVVEKGSIAINGVSLTVAGVSRDTFRVSLIPFTLAHTNLGDLDVGDTVNVELDILGKYIYVLVQPYLEFLQGVAHALRDHRGSD